jgi:hypothetical protein
MVKAVHEPHNDLLSGCRQGPPHPARPAARIG